MLLRVRFGISCLFVALAPSLFAACSGSTSGSNGSVCAGFCGVLLKCGPQNSQCTFQDPSATADACTSACEGAFAAVSPADESVVTACYSCAIDAAAGSCSAFMSANPPAQCQSTCGSAAFQTALHDWGNKFSAAATANSALTCTDGQNVFAGETCSSGGPGDGSSCTYSCCNGSTCGATPDVEISCTQTTGGQLGCTCTAGKSKGKVVSVTSCDAVSSLDLWATCNE